MSPSLNIEPRDFVTTINYFKATDDELEHDNLPQKKFGKTDDDSVEVQVHDVRGREHEFNLRDHGFVYAHIESTGKDEDFFNPEWVKSVYYKEVADVVKEITGCDHAVVYQHVNRSAAQSLDESNPANMGDASLNGPATKPHTDFGGVHMDTYIHMLGPQLPEAGAYERWKKASRWAMMGAWKPRRTVTRDPLIVADARSMADRDYLHVVRNLGPLKMGNYVIAQPAAAQPHSWHYLHKQRPDELVIFSGTDTKREGMGWRCAHTAAVDAEYANEAPRESIETRVLCLWD